MTDASLTATELELLHGVLDLARTGATAALSNALDSGVPVNLTSADGDSLLMLAAYYCHPGTAEMLLSRAADTERVNDRGQTALGAAVFRQQPRIIEMLLAVGADPDGGAPSARAIATFFGLDSMSGLLSRREQPRVRLATAATEMNEGDAGA